MPRNVNSFPGHGRPLVETQVSRLTTATSAARSVGATDRHGQRGPYCLIAVATPSPSVTSPAAASRTGRTRREPASVRSPSETTATVYRRGVDGTRTRKAKLPSGWATRSARFCEPIQSSTVAPGLAVPCTESGTPGARQAGRLDSITGGVWRPCRGGEDRQRRRVR